MAPHYETGGDNIYFVKIRATEEFDPEYVDPEIEPKFTDQLIKIRVTNITEKPEFITPPYFSIDEQTDKAFTVEVTTRDQNKNLVIQLDPRFSDGDNRHFMEAEQGNAFQFVFPPDYENPDNDTDNIYLMALRAGPIDPDTGAPLEVWSYHFTK